VTDAEQKGATGDGGAMTVVLVHWNQAARCADTIEAFQRQGLAVRLLVVDNGSDADELEQLRRTVANSPHEVDLLEVGANTGFGPGANVGFRDWLASGAGEWVALAPHDALPAEGTLARLIAAAEARPRAGLACADVGAGETPVYDPYFGGMTMPAAPGLEGWQSVDYPHGTLLIAHRACLSEIGLFDERYFAYCEETDLGLRASAAGWDVGLVHGAMVKNPTMRSGSPVTDYLMHRNTLLLVREHSGRYHVSIRFVIAIFQLGRGLVQKSYAPFIFSAKGRLWGLADFARGRFGPPPSALMTEAGEPLDRGLAGQGRT
jgi:N-acetylglucosaminyl-diphospho-decaprenol L-rhamnosyltransferase